MSKTNNFLHDSLSIEVAKSDIDATITWHGIIDSQNPEPNLLSFLENITEELKDKNLVIDFRSLSYVNSVNILLIINLVRNLGPYNTSVAAIFSSKHDWQRLMSQCMKVITRSMKNIQVECR